MTDREKYRKDHLHTWIESAISGLEKQVDEKEMVSILESCGRACARHGRVVVDAEAIRNSGKRIDELLDKLSHDTSGMVEWRREDGTVQLIYKKCFCPLRGEGFVSVPSFCNCSVGWIREVFETASGRPVRVELGQTIGRGDPVCKFIIR